MTAKKPASERRTLGWFRVTDSERWACGGRCQACRGPCQTPVEFGKRFRRGGCVEEIRYCRRCAQNDGLPLGVR